MNKSVIMGQVRHLLTFVGGFAVAYGYLDEAGSQEIIGAVLMIVGQVWSAVEKKQQ